MTSWLHFEKFASVSRKNEITLNTGAKKSYRSDVISMAKGRLSRLNEILALLKENNGEMKFKDLYGKMALKYDITKRTF